jgi:hypothetical protein
MDRTGHATSQMLNKYRPQARHAAELAQGWPAPLDSALPELHSTDENRCSPDQGTNHEVSREMTASRIFEQYRVGRKGLEPLTYGLKVRSSTD